MMMIYCSAKACAIFYNVSALCFAFESSALRLYEQNFRRPLVVFFLFMALRLGRIGRNETNGTNGINGINGKFPIKHSVTHQSYQAKRPHLSHQAKRYPSILSSVSAPIYPSPCAPKSAHYFLSEGVRFGLSQK